MKIFNKKLLLILLIILVIFSFMFNKKEEKVVVLDDVKIMNDNSGKFTMFIKESEEYKPYEKDSFPIGYKLNTENSKCMDEDDKVIDTSLTYKNNALTVKGNKTIYCNLYFDEEENIVKDLSGNGNNGLSYAAKWDDEGITTSTEDTRGYVDCGLSGYDFKNNISIIVRVKGNKFIDNWQIFLGNMTIEERKGFSFPMYLSHVVYFHIFQSPDVSYSLLDEVKNSHPSFQINEWYTLVGTYDNNTINFYINGKKYSDNIGSDKLATTEAPILLGTYPLKTDDYYTEGGEYSYATFSDLLIFDRALTDEEIQENYTGKINSEKVSKDNLLLYYKFQK